MHRAEFIAMTAAATNKTQLETDRSLSAFLDTLRVALSEGKSVKIADFGTFKTVWRRDRTGTNPRTKQPIVIPGHNAIVFVPGKGLKELVN
jgi:nucleoid DNA-binding protein